MARAKEFEADDGINYAEQDWVERLPQLTRNHGADHILELVGSQYLGNSMRAGVIQRSVTRQGVQEGLRLSQCCDIAQNNQTKKSVVCQVLCLKCTSKLPLEPAEQLAMVDSVNRVNRSGF